MILARSGTEPNDRSAPIDFFPKKTFASKTRQKFSLEKDRSGRGPCREAQQGTPSAFELRECEPKKNPAWEAGLYGLLLLSRVRFLRQRRGYAGLSLLLFPLFLLLIMIIVLLIWHLLASMSVYRCRILPPPVKTFFCAHVIEARLVPYIKKDSIYKCLYSLTGPTSGSC